MKILGLNPNINSKTNYANKTRVNFSAVPVTPAAIKKLDVFEGKTTAEIIKKIIEEGNNNAKKYVSDPLSGLSEKFLAKVIRTAQMIEFSTPEKEQIGKELDIYANPFRVSTFYRGEPGDDYRLLFDLAHESLDFASYQGKDYPYNSILESIQKRLNDLRGSEKGLQRIKALKETYDIL